MRMIYKTLVLFILFFISFHPSGAQQPKKEKPPQVYKDIEKYSKKKGVTKFFYKLLFRSPSTKSYNKDTSHVYLSGAYKKSQCRYIRNITITTNDPFGYNIGKNTVNVKSPFERFGNNSHVKTHEITIKNLLLFKQGMEFDSLRVKESERLIRQQPYVHDVVLIPVPVAHSDSVDVIIRELDNWSTIPIIGLSTSFR